MLLQLYYLVATGNDRDGRFQNIRWAAEYLLGYLNCSRQLLWFAGFEHV